MNLSKRTFGVELEHHNTNIDTLSLHKLVQEKFGRGWKVERDPGGNHEAISPILNGNDGILEVQACLDFLKGLGGVMLVDDGLHVHHDAKEFLDDTYGPDRACALIKSWQVNQPVISSMLPQHRSDNTKLYHGIAPFKTITPQRYRTMTTCYRDAYWGSARPMLEKLGGVSDRFTAIAIRGAHKTVEIRQHQGTFDGARCAAWVEFGQRFIETTLDKRALKAYKNPGDLMRGIGMEDSNIQLLEVVEKCAY